MGPLLLAEGRPVPCLQGCGQKIGRLPCARAGWGFRHLEPALWATCLLWNPWRRCPLCWVCSGRFLPRRIVPPCTAFLSVDEPLL